MRNALVIVMPKGRQAEKKQLHHECNADNSWCFQYPKLQWTREHRRVVDIPKWQHSQYKVQKTWGANSYAVVISGSIYLLLKKSNDWMEEDL